LGYERRMTSGPRLVLTAIHDLNTRPASLTESHGRTMAKLIAAAKGKPHGGFEVVELAVPPAVFIAARKALGRGKDVVAIYDLFPTPVKLTPEIRHIAARFLAAEALWTLAEEGKLGDAALDVRIPTPRGWDRDPRAIQQKLLEAGALDLSDEDIAAFQSVRSAFDPA